MKIRPRFTAGSLAFHAFASATPFNPYAINIDEATAVTLCPADTQGAKIKNLPIEKRDTAKVVFSIKVPKPLRQGPYSTNADSDAVPSTTPSVHAKRPDEEKAEGETQEESPIEIVEEDLSDDAILSRYGLSGTTVPATALISTTPESSVAAVDTAVLIGPPQPQQTVEVGNGIEAIEVTDIVESMFDDTRLIHQLAQSDIDAIDICKSYAFEPSQVNWHVADTHRWMQIYTLMNQDRDYFKRNGLSSTIAFDFLGIANYKCAIGTSHLCTVDCPTVVRGIEDLTTARHVFFVLTSSSHMLTVTELIHNAMEASQSNLHAMVGKMSLDYFFTTPTKGEVERGKAWQFFIQLTIWAVQTAITSIIPMIPWRLAQDCVVKAIRRVFFHNYGKDVLTIDGLEDNTEARALIADTMTEMMVSVGKDPGGLLVPPKYHRAMASDWSDIESKVGQRWLNAMKQKNAKPKTWLGTFVKNCETGGFGRAMGKVWSGMRDATWGALERVAGKWWWFRDGAESVEIESDADSTLDDLDSLDSHDSHDSHHSGKSHKTHKNGKDGGYFDGAVRPQATGSAGGRDGSVNWNDWEGKVKEWGGSMSDAAGPRSHWEDTSEGSRRMASSDLGFDGHRSGGSGYGGPIPGRFENSVSSGAGLTNNGGRGNSGARGSGGGSNVGLKSPVSGSASGRQSKSGSKSGGRNSGGSNAGGRNSGGSGSGGTNSGGLAAGMGNSVQSSLKGSNAGSSIGGGSKIGGGGSNSRGSKSGSKSGNSGSGSSNAAVMGSGSGRPLSDFLSNIQNEAHITWGDGIDPAPITPYDSVSNLGSPMRQSSRTQTSHKPYHKNNPKLVSLGPMEEWKDRDQWKKSKDVGFSTEEMLIDIWTRGVDFSHTIPKPKGFDSISKKIDYASKAASMLLPIAINLAMPMYLRDLFDAFTWTGTDMGSEYNNAHMKWIVQESGRYARRMLKENVNRLYSSSDVTIDGSTFMSNALAMGSFLPADSGALKQWTESTVEDALTKNMYFKTLNAVMKAQKHFISCTTDLQYKPHTNRLIDKKTRKVNACFSDNTGPENLRGCIPASPATNGKETVCYLYRWADRGIVISHHIEEPWGWQQLASFDAVPADIIKSSYLSRRYSLGDEQYDLLTDPASLARGPSAEFITDPTTPGMFSIPVCNTPYNWNGHTNGYSYWDDMNPWSARKSLPCYCGVLGNETQSVWSSMRLDVSEKRGEYLTMLCPRQISDKIENRLERWIAKCRLRVSKILLTHHQRFDHFCDIVIDEIEARGIISADEFYPELTHVIMCKARGSRNKTCKKYSHTPMDMAWLEAEALREKNRRKGSNGMAEIEQSQREFDAEDEEALRELETKEGMDVTIEQLELEEPVEPKSSSSSRLPKPTEAALVKPYAHMGKERPKPTPVTASASETPTVPATTTVTKAYKNHKDYKLDDF